MLRAGSVVLLSLAVALPASADSRGAGGSLTLSARGASEVEPVVDERVLAATGHVDLRALYGKRWAFAADFGVELGVEAPAGFAYAIRLSPVGAALRFGRRGWLGVVGGVGRSGVVGRVPITLELPVTAFVAMDLGSWIRLSSRVRTAWVPLSDRRGDGSRLAGVDELDFEAGVAIGRREGRSSRGVYSDGTYVGVFVREQQQQRLVGVSVAVAISGAGRF